MQRTIINLMLIILLTSFAVSAQTERKAIRKGNKEFKKGEFIDSEIMYRSALDLNPSSFKGNFNLGGALYKQEKFEEAEQIFSDVTTEQNSAEELSYAYHNLGNAHFQKEEYDKSVEAYKNALRNNPSDVETKYNLAQAQRMLQQQQEQQQNQDQNQDQNKDQNKDNQDNQQDKKDQENDQDKQNKENEENKEQQDKQQPKQQQISKEDARRMLEALQNDEKKVQEKVQKEKAKQAKVKVEKNW